MAISLSRSRPGITRKQKAEAANFEAFRQAHPNFAGRPLAGIQRGGDPPDVLCLDASGNRIGVELSQWVNQRQMAASKRRFKVEDSYRLAIRSPEVEPPANIGLVFIYAKDTTPLAPENAPAFRDELYKFVRAVDDAWQLNPDWDDPQGYAFTDFKGYSTLAQYVEGLDFYARGRRFDPQLGADWLTFRAHGGAPYAGLDARRFVGEHQKENSQIRQAAQQTQIAAATASGVLPFGVLRRSRSAQYTVRCARIRIPGNRSASGP